MRITGFRLIALAVLAPIVALLVISIARPAPASAHPLGNFTVNRYSRLELYSDAIRIRYVLDMAEIPAFQEITEIDSNGDGELTSAENAAYLLRKEEDIAGNLRLEANGSDLDLDVIASDISYPEGQAGLRTLRLSLLLQAPVTGLSVSLEYDDNNYSDRIGWKEVVARPAPGVALTSSDVSSDDMSAELTAYPTDLLSSSMDVTSANLSFEPGEGATAPVIESGSEQTPTREKAPPRAGGGFAALIASEELTLPVILLSMLLALGFGAIHALEPGHGKTFVAAYFVGVKGTVRQALALGLIVAATHTIGVLAVGLVTLFGSQYVLPEKLYPYLSLASGLMVLALGVRLLAARAGGLRAWRQFRSILQGPRRAHDPDHTHEHNHQHAHETPGGPPWKSLLALGLADGLTPSPSALIVLLAAVSLDRVGLGVLLIVAFSVGLAVVLTVVSLALLFARRFAQWLGDRNESKRDGVYPGSAAGALGTALLRAAPLGGAFGLAAVGAVLTARALTASGLAVF